MVANDQIVYEKYGKPENGQIDYYRINYVPKGHYPILSESKGYYIINSLEYVEEEKYVWHQDV